MQPDTLAFVEVRTRTAWEDQAVPPELSVTLEKDRRQREPGAVFCPNAT
jgi:hypothetical protein